MPQLLVHDKARQDIRLISDHIAKNNLAAALRFVDAAELTIEFLRSFPGAGPRIEPAVQAIPELRFWPIKRFRSYLVLYRPLSDGMEIFRVVHAARDMFRVMSK